MAEKPIVLKSINIEDGSRCVDLFERPDGTYGFEEFRRDHEDRRGWFPIGFYADLVFLSEEAALHQARSKVTWLDAVLKTEKP